MTQFPSAFTAAASFDRALVEERASRIGHEFRGKGVNVELGPVTGGPLGRSYVHSSGNGAKVDLAVRTGVVTGKVSSRT